MGAVRVVDGIVVEVSPAAPVGVLEVVDVEVVDVVVVAMLEVVSVGVPAGGELEIDTVLVDSPQPAIASAAQAPSIRTIDLPEANPRGRIEPGVRGRDMGVHGIELRVPRSQLSLRIGLRARHSPSLDNSFHSPALDKLISHC